jgi:putative transposase
MARFARVVVPGCAYHVTQRGNRRGEIFLRDEDRDVYRDLLGEYSRRFGLEVWAYCWMSNHVHLLVAAHRPDSLARAIGISHRRYSRYLNRRQGWTGHLWANRFFSTLLDAVHLLHAVRYVELNPVRAGLADDAAAYPWSSARAHARGLADPLLSPQRPFPGAIEDWSAWLRQGLEPEHLENLRMNTSTGRPSGSPEFVLELEKTLGRRLRPLAWGTGNRGQVSQ